MRLISHSLKNNLLTKLQFSSELPKITQQYLEIHLEANRLNVQFKEQFFLWFSFNQTFSNLIVIK